MSAELPSSPNYKLQKKLMRRRSIRESWPVLVWLGMIFACVWAYRAGGQFHRMRGVVFKPVEIVAPLFEGKLVPLTDAEGQPKELKQGMRVEAGEVVAKLDDAYLKLEIEAAKQEAEIASTNQSVELYFQVRDAEEQLFLHRNDLQRIQDELVALQKEKAIAEEQRNSGLITSADVAAIQTSIESAVAEEKSLQRTVQNTEEAITEGKTQIAKLNEQAAILTDPEQSSIIKLLQEKINHSEIKATNSGYIDTIYAFAGSVVKAGDPIVTILADQAKTIIALIPEDNAGDLQVGNKVYVARPNDAKTFIEATVLTLGPGMTQIPDYASQIRDRMIRGRLVELGNMEGFAETLIPGSSVIISLEKPGRIPFLPWFVD